MQPLVARPITGPVTDEERHYALNALTTTQQHLHDVIAGLSDAQLTYRPAPDRWSIADCVEHIVLVERGLFRALQTALSAAADPDKRQGVRLLDVDVVKAGRSRSVRVPAPSPFVPTGRYGSVTAALQAFDEERQAVLAFIAQTTADFRTYYVPHFVLGMLDAYQAVLLMAAHVERHRKQIDELKAEAGFPVAA